MIREVSHKPGPHWIGDGSHDDRDSGCGALDRMGRRGALNDDDVNFALNQFGSQLRQARVISSSASLHDYHVTSLEYPASSSPFRNACASLLSGGSPPRSTPIRGGEPVCRASAVRSTP